jgi:DNA-binding NarL/FixJ family response regulator
MDKIKVLYIDDEHDNLMAFNSTFRRMFDVYIAESAAKGIEILKTEAIEILIADQRMPEMTGVEFFESILDDYPNPIRILLTGYSDITAVKDAINKGQVYKYLNKPWDEYELKITIENNNNIDIILMDINMPQLNGIDATEIIKKLYKKINILALTMHNEESYITKMITSGALGYILKDTNSTNLLDAVKTVAKGDSYYSNEVTSTIVNHLMHNQKEKKPTLSEREIEIVKLLMDGKTNKKIGAAFNISPRTVETHRRNILNKLELSNTAELINYAYKNNLID